MYILQDFYVYDLSGNKMTKRDIREAQKRNLIVRYTADEFYIVGSFNAILSYLTDYIGVEMLPEYLYQLKDVM